MKQIIGKHEEKERLWAEEVDRLKKKIKDKRSSELSKSQQIKPPDRKSSTKPSSDLGHEIFSYLVLQASTI